MSVTEIDHWIVWLWPGLSSDALTEIVKLLQVGTRTALSIRLARGVVGGGVAVGARGGVGDGQFTVMDV